MEEEFVVCLGCLKAIESREGTLDTEHVYFSEDDHQECGWCGEEIEEGYIIE